MTSIENPRRLLCLGIAVFILIPGCAPTAPPTEEAPAATEPPQAEPPPTAPAPTDTPAPVWLAEAETYRDDFAGIEMNIPAGWTIIDVDPQIKEQGQAYSVTLQSWDSDTSGTEGIPAGGTKIDVLVFRSGAASLQEAAAQRRMELEAADPPQPIQRQQEWTLAGGLQAVRWQLEGQFGPSAEVILVANDRTILLGGLGDFELFDQIVQTLRPIDPAS